MNIDEYADLLKKERGGKGYGFLAERVPTSPEAPYRIAVLKNKIHASDPVALLLGGTGSYIETCNGFLKKFNDFLSSDPELSQVRSCVAIQDLGKNYQEQIPRIASILSQRYPKIWFLMKNITQHPIAKYKGDTMFFQDIYEAVIQPKITSPTGERLPKDTLLKNMRGVTMIAYCAGGHTAIQLENITQQQMTKLGYTPKEITEALSQIVVIGYAMSCPYEKSKMRFFSFETSSDYDSLNFSTAFRQYLLYQKDFGLLHSATQQSDTFICEKLREHITLHKVTEEYLQKLSKEADPEHTEAKTDDYNDHTFIGYVPKTGFSQQAIDLQNLFKQIISNVLKNSISNSKGNKFIPLPQSYELIQNDKLLFQMNKSYLLTHNDYTLNYLPFNMVKYTTFMPTILLALRISFKTYCKQR